MRTIPVLLAASLLATPGTAQCPPSDGMFAGTWAAFSTVEDSPHGLAGETLFDKPAGFLRTPPSRWAPMPGAPDFRFDVLFRQCGLGAPFPDVDATSIGEDWILADANGRIDVPANRWAAITFSVSASSRGQPNSLIRAETASPDGVGGDLFSLVLPGSALPPAHVDNPRLALQRSQTGLSEGDIDALDHFMRLNRMSTGIANGLFATPQWFFSISSATLARVPATWFGGTPPSGATIFVVTLSRVTGTWTCPRVYLSFRDLGLAQTEDVDAIAIDLRNQRMLFSTKTRTRNEILYVDLGADIGNPVPYADQGGQTVTDKAGLIEDDDVDAICAIDPSLRSRPGEPLNPMFHSVGAPFPLAFGLPRAGDGTAFRVPSANGVDAFETYVAGWPPAGAGDGFAILLASPGASTSPLIDVGVVARDPRDPFCGNPVGLTVPIPATLALQGTPIMFRWFLVDDRFATLAEATPTLVRL
ncbi:MAG: hypothetical protein IPM29_22225 [Planctomycetes bacterium]|nr:hypothetical protein [Planctomycetota bacterium]